MTVATTSNSITYAGTGGTTAFAFPFALPDDTLTNQAADLLVTLVNAAGVSTVIAYGAGTTQYQLAVNAPIAPNPTSVGGTVTYNPSGVPIPIGSTLTIQRILPETQGVSLQNQGTLWQTVIEQALDYLTMTNQQLQALFGRGIVAPATDPAGLNYTLPSATARANTGLAFDASGNVIAGTTPASGTISSAMQPVVSAATLAAGRTAFGLGAAATEGIGGGLQDDGASNLRVFFANNALTGAVAITSANFLQKIKYTGPGTITLPRANTLWAGFGFWVENLLTGGNLTIAINVNDKIESGASGVSVILPQGVSLYISTNALASGTWFLELAKGATVSSPPQGAYKNLSIKVLTNTTIAISVEQVVTTDGLQYYTNPLVAGSINMAVNGVNGLDTGAIAAARSYFIWVIHNPITTAVGAIASLQSTANATFLANLPAGFTAYARIGAVKTLGAALLMGTWQFGKQVQYVVGLAQTTALPVVATGAFGTWAVGAGIVYTVAAVRGDASAAGFVPSTASEVLLVASNNWAGNAIAGISVAPNTSYSGQGTSNIPPLTLSTVAGANQTQQVEMTLESDNIAYAGAGAGSAVVCQGWVDNI